MSVADLKNRLADVPGIHSLSMSLDRGVIALRWGDRHEAVVGAAASDSEIETAVRNASKLPPMSPILDKPAPAAAPTAQEGKPMSANPADTMGALDRVMSDHVKQMADIHAAQLRILEASLARQRDTVARGVGSFAEKIDGQTDDFAAMMSRYTNGFGS